MAIVKCDACGGHGTVEQYDPMPRLIKVWLSLDESDRAEVIVYARYLAAKRSKARAASA